MLKKGFAQYKLDQEKVSPNYKMDSVLVANYLKVKIKKIPLGLIPEDIQNFIVELFTEVENTTGNLKNDSLYKCVMDFC